MQRIFGWCRKKKLYMTTFFSCIFDNIGEPFLNEVRCIKKHKVPIGPTPSFPFYLLLLFLLLSIPLLFSSIVLKFHPYKNINVETRKVSMETNKMGIWSLNHLTVINMIQSCQGYPEC